MCILRHCPGSVRQVLGVQSPPTGLPPSMCRARVTLPILQVEKLRPREAWRGAAWVGKRRKGACAFAAPLPSCFPSIMEQASLLCLPLVSPSCLCGLLLWNSPTGPHQDSAPLQVPFLQLILWPSPHTRGLPEKIFRFKKSLLCQGCWHFKGCP